MSALSKFLGRAEIAMRTVAGVCLLGMAFLTGADVGGRGAFNTPIFGSEEITAILATLAVGLSLPYAHSQGVHVGVEILVRRLGKRTRNAIKLVTDLAAMALFAVVSWRMWIYAGTMKRSGLVSMNLELPYYYVIYALAFGFAVFTLFLARDVIRILRGGGE